MVMFQESFRKNPNITQLAPKLFIYKNFITGNLLEKINLILKDHINSPMVDHNVNWYNSRVTQGIPEIHEVWEQASELIYPELVMHPQLALLRSKPGEKGMYAHSDAPGQPHEDCGPVCGTCDLAYKNLISPDLWNTCCRLHYGLIVYFGDFEGGEVYYPNINKQGKFIGNYEPFDNNEELSVKPENGDLIIHGAHSDYAHGVKEVTKGVRFSFSNFVLPTYANPGTFFSYKTPEYENQINNIKKDPRIKEYPLVIWNQWCQIMNDYKWEEPDALKEDKKNGIKSLRYRDAN